MWRIRLNSATLANVTHRELEKVADETSTQVRVQMINRWRVKMIQKGLYKVGDSPRKRGGQKKRNKTAIRIVLILESNHHIHVQPPRTEGPLR